MQKGEVLKKWLKDISDFIVANKSAEGFESEFKLLHETLGDFNAILGLMRIYNEDGKADMTPLFATRILHASSMLYCGRLIMDQALLADAKLRELGEDYFDAAYYKGKIASARYYIRNEMPKVGALRRIIEIGDTSAIDLAEESLG
jgi:hypothetical protein